MYITHAKSGNRNSFWNGVASVQDHGKEHKMQTDNKQTIVILGAAGRIGDAAAKAFLAAGWRVKGVARNAKAAALRPGVEVLEADAYDRQSLIRAVEGADVILNALNPKYTEWKTAVMPLAENVMAAAEASGALHLFPGNVYNFGHAIGLNTGEDAPQTASTAKARIRIEAEDLFRQRAEERGVRTVILRGGDFYGGVKPESWMDLFILKELKKDVFTWPGPADIPHAFAYLPDFAEAFVAVAEKRRPLAPFERFHFAGHTMTGNEMHMAAEEAAGRPLRFKKMGWTMIRLAGLVVPIAREVAVMSYLWRTPHSLDGTRLQRFAGKLRATKPAEALRAAISDLELDAPLRLAA
jgi:nucleoside-diphosphate-sugar epimerase